MQTINRNNYEEYFLLYVDNELDAMQRLAVEDFVHQNADLAVELEMLMGTKLSPDIIEFVDKDNLLRTEGNTINESNYEEYFLLYIDNELSHTKREEVETYVLQHPKLQDEFMSLKQAVLSPELISYGNKADLYRRERKRAIYLRPWSLAAAAVFIGVCAVGLWLMQGSSDVTAPVAVNNVPPTELKQNKPAENNTVTAPVDSIHQQVQQPQPVITAKSSPVSKEKKADAESLAIKQKARELVNKALQEDKNREEPIIAFEPTANHHNNIEVEEKEPPVQPHGIADVPGPSKLKEINTNDARAFTNTSSMNENNGNPYPVTYKEINTNDDDRSLHVGMLDLNKDKVRHLFKKAGRMFVNKSGTEDGKLQVANFEIETKKQ